MCPCPPPSLAAAAGIGYDWKSDIWSLGCLLYELATLKSPFEMEGADLYAVFKKISKGDYARIPPDRHVGPLARLTNAMLQLDPAARPAAAEVAGARPALWKHAGACLPACADAFLPASYAYLLFRPPSPFEASPARPCGCICCSRPFKHK